METLFTFKRHYYIHFPSLYHVYHTKHGDLQTYIVWTSVDVPTGLRKWITVLKNAVVVNAAVSGQSNYTWRGRRRTPITVILPAVLHTQWVDTNAHIKRLTAWLLCYCMLYCASFMYRHLVEHLLQLFYCSLMSYYLYWSLLQV